MSDRSNPRENPQVSAEVGYTPETPSWSEHGHGRVHSWPGPVQGHAKQFVGDIGARIDAADSEVLGAFRGQLCKIEQLSAIESRHYSGWSERQ
jgi:hypothetical protein